jgi:hypothetical protein
MALTIENPEIEQLAAEVAALSALTETEAVRDALLRERSRLEASKKLPNGEEILCYLREKVWPTLPPGASVPLTRDQEDQILGHGPDGYPT